MNEQVDATTSGSGELVLSGSYLPERIYLLPIHNRPFFPAQIQPLVIPRERWEATIDRVTDTTHKTVGLSFIDEVPLDELVVDDFSEIGTAVQMHRVAIEEGRIQFIAQGLKRFKIDRWISKKAPYLVEVTYLEDTEDASDEARAYALSIVNGIKELLPLNPLYGEELKHYLNRFSPNQPGPLTDFAAAITSAKGQDLQDVLNTLPLLERMQKVLPLLRKEVEVARLQGEISEEVNQKIKKRQREFFLREQLQIIQRELGISKDDKTAEADEFKARLKGKVLPEAVQKRLDEELKKFSVLESGSAEYTVTRNYLDWITCLPWGITSADSLDLKHARKTLDKDHDGLDDVKDHIVEFLAEGHFKGDVGGSIILLVGPPGVGKTSIGRSIAETLGRKFYRFSLGGMRDEAEIKGHRRTYIGAMPGKLLQALKECETENPVILLDEIDKLGSSFQGDPASALLEVLDPEQNANFLDHYLDVRVDLSKVLFLCTANLLDTIPGPLLDRMEVIHLAGYITEEKLAIAKNHLWPKLLKRAKLKKKQVNINDAALRALIEGYAREAGVRKLEKMLHRILRKAAVELLAEDAPSSIRVGVKNLQDYAGMPEFRSDQLMKGVGVVTGLAWTAMGGATLSIEAARVHTLTRGLKLTGKLGDVMKESAEIAYSYVMSNLKAFGASPEFYDESFIHLHVPEGATPKDGPSAGITMATALLSLALKRKPAKIAMTGELSLTGQVLAVGGIREKVIAAKRSNINKLILPEANRRDYDELPEHLYQGVEVCFVSHYKEVVAQVF